MSRAKSGPSVNEASVYRMASKWEKVVDEAASISLGCKLIICGRSVNWWDKELRQLVKDCRACFAKSLDKDSNWSGYLKIIRKLKQKIRKKGKSCREDLWLQ